MHEALILRLLRAHGPLTRAELRTLCDLSRTTLYAAVGALMDSGAVVASIPETARRKRGRPAEVLAVVPAPGQLLGLEFARRAVRVAVMDAGHKIVGVAGEPHAPETSWQARIDLAWQLADSLTGERLRPGVFRGIGLGVVGPVASPDRDPMTEPWHNAISVLVRERFGAQVVIDNNTRLATLAETIWGAATGAQNAVYLRLSYGVGGGLVMAGAVHRGSQGRSGMFGHIAVEPDGAPCGCGGTGCLETVASVNAVLDACRAAGGTAADMPDLLAALESGDRTAHAVLARVGAYVGRVLADVGHAVGPDLIVLGGELTDTGRALTAPIEHVLSTQAARGSFGVPRVVPTRLGDTAAALGGIALLQRHMTRGVPRQ